MNQAQDDTAAFIAGLTALGLTLDNQQQERFSAYAALLIEWNKRFNLLGPAAVRSLWSRHFLDALTLVRALPENAGTMPYALLDVGSGAGLPGVPLQILFPRWQVTLLEVTAKKVRFLETAASELGIDTLHIAPGRAEELAHVRRYREAYDICVARAVTQTAALVELTLPFVTIGGSAILYKGMRDLEHELLAAEGPRTILGAAAPDVISINLAGDDARCLVRYDKRAPTPLTLPRPTGVPEQRALTPAEAGWT